MGCRVFATPLFNLLLFYILQICGIVMCKLVYGKNHRWGH